MDLEFDYIGIKNKAKGKRQFEVQRTVRKNIDESVGSMGRKAGGIYINPKQFGGLAKPCMKETMAFLNCLSLNHNSDDKCVRHKDLLNACMDAQAGKKKNPWGSINYHLQRLSRGRK